MNANWTLPALTSTYANFLAEMKSRDEDLAIWFDGTTSTNLTVGTKRWNSTSSKFEKWSGTAWSDLSTLYEIKVRDSDKLNGQTASYYAVSSHGHSAVTTTVNGFMSYTDKVKLDAIAANANNYSHPTGDGNLHVPANGIANNGKFLQATAVAGSYVWANVPATSLSTLGVTATAAELNILDGVTVTTAELNILDGALITVTQLNYLNTLSSDAQTQINTKAPLSSAALTGIPTAPTAAVGTNTTQIATTAFVKANTSTVTSSIVGTATAGLGVGAVGSYALCKSNAEVNFSAGATTAGSNLMYSNVPGDLTSGTLSGTWRLMGRASSSTFNGASVTLFLRIA